MYWLLVVLFLLPAPVWAEQARGVSSLPTPIIPLIPDNAGPEDARLNEYENFIGGFDESAKSTALPTVATTAAATLSVQAVPKVAKPTRPQIRIYTGSTQVKLGRSVENGVTIYRGNPDDEGRKKPGR